MLLVVTAAVLAAHVAVIENTTLSFDPHEPLGTRVFSTRTLRPPPESAPSSATPTPAKPPSGVRQTAAQAPAEPTAVLVLATTKTAPDKVAPPLPEPAVQAEAPSPPASAPVPAAPRLAASAAEAPLAVASAPSTSVAVAPRSDAATPPPLSKDAALEARSYTIPGSVVLKFNATGQRGAQPQQASGLMSWQHDGRRYEARMEIGAFGIGARAFTSSGALTADGLAPQRFADKRRTEVAAHFERDQGRVVFSANTPSAPLQPGAQDQLSIFIQLASMVGGEPRKFPPGASITLQTVGARSAEPWTFTVEAPETLTLPGGKLATVKLVRNPGKDYDQKVELWLAPELSYLPARIRISFANGDFVDQQWRASSAQ